MAEFTYHGGRGFAAEPGDLLRIQHVSGKRFLAVFLDVLKPEPWKLQKIRILTEGGLQDTITTVFFRMERLCKADDIHGRMES